MATVYRWGKYRISTKNHTKAYIAGKDKTESELYNLIVSKYGKDSYEAKSLDYYGDVDIGNAFDDSYDTLSYFATDDDLYNGKITISDSEYDLKRLGSFWGTPVSWGGASTRYFIADADETDVVLHKIEINENTSSYDHSCTGDIIKVAVRLETSETVRGSYISDVTSTSRSAYPDNNYSGSYWYVYKGIDNQSPTISGSNLDLGGKVEDFNIEYVVSDADGDSCTVDITVDNVKKVSAKSVTLNTKYTYPIKIDDFTLGRHTVAIVAKDSKGATSPARTYTFTKSNTAPTISGTDTDLGGKSTAFTETYRVTDKNSEDVKVTVILDDTEIATVSSAQDKDLSFTITDEQLLSFEIGSTHTITIKADDGKGGVAYRRYTFTKINRPPIISGSDGDLGAKKETFTQKFSFTDVEKDKIYSRVYLDGKQVLENLEVEDGKEYSYSISHDDFIRLKYGKHEIKIEAWDDYSENSKVYRIYTFEKVLNGLEVEIKINEFDVQPKKIIAVPHGIFADDATMAVEACNNYLDEQPTWEDITTESKAARAYAFTNATKTNAKWSIGVRVIVENGASNLSSVLRGVKGGYE